MNEQEAIDFKARIKAAGGDLCEQLCGRCTLELSLERLSNTLQKGAAIDDAAMASPEICEGLARAAINYELLNGYRRILQKNNVPCVCVMPKWPEQIH